MHADRLHLLTNAVAPLHQSVSTERAEIVKKKLAEIYGEPSARTNVLYPVRAIRRKNIGELLLWSLLVEDETFAVTLAPLNPKERASYNVRVSVAKALELPVLFDVGADGGLSLEDN